jgi:general secretion pathway protein G
MTPSRRRWMAACTSLPVLAVAGLALGMLGAIIAYRTSWRSNCDFSLKAPDDIRSIDAALRAFVIANGGDYPETLRVLETPDIHGRTFLEGRYVPKDLWGNDYRYEPPTAEHPYPRIYTLGKDGRPGGTGDDADVDNLTLVNRR